MNHKLRYLRKDFSLLYLVQQKLFPLRRKDGSCPGWEGDVIAHISLQQSPEPVESSAKVRCKDRPVSRVVRGYAARRYAYPFWSAQIHSPLLQPPGQPTPVLACAADLTQKARYSPPLLQLPFLTIPSTQTRLHSPQGQRSGKVGSSFLTESFFLN